MDFARATTADSALGRQTRTAPPAGGDRRSGARGIGRLAGHGCRLHGRGQCWAGTDRPTPTRPSTSGLIRRRALPTSACSSPPPSAASAKPRIGRARALVEADDHKLRLTVEDGGGLAVAWQATARDASLTGRSLLEPAIRTAAAGETGRAGADSPGEFVVSGSGFRAPTWSIEPRSAGRAGSPGAGGRCGESARVPRARGNESGPDAGRASAEGGGGAHAIADSAEQAGRPGASTACTSASARPLGAAPCSLLAQRLGETARGRFAAVGDAGPTTPAPPAPGAATPTADADPRGAGSPIPPRSRLDLHRPCRSAWQATPARFGRRAARTRSTEEVREVLQSASAARGPRPADGEHRLRRCEAMPAVGVAAGGDAGASRPAPPSTPSPSSPSSKT